MKRLAIGAISCAWLMSAATHVAAQPLSDTKEWLDDRLADATIGAPMRECYEAAERYRRAYENSLDQLFEQQDELFGGRRVDRDKANRLADDADQAVRQFVNRCQAAALDGAKQAYEFPVKYGRTRLRSANEAGEKIDESIDYTQKQARRGKQLYDAGKRAWGLANPSKEISRDNQTGRLPVYDIRDGRGVSEMWLVGYQTPQGFAPLAAPRLIHRIRDGGSSAGAPKNNALPPASPPRPSPPGTSAPDRPYSGERQGLPQ